MGDILLLRVVGNGHAGRSDLVTRRLQFSRCELANLFFVGIGYRYVSGLNCVDCRLRSGGAGGDCDRSECGACTVLVNDVPHYSCSILTHTVRGKQITTIEGLASADGTLHPVQQGVVDEQGFQCAFCMPGFVMATVGYLKTEPNPTRQQLAHGVSGNLCRCQDYDKILTALMRGAEHLRGA